MEIKAFLDFNQKIPRSFASGVKNNINGRHSRERGNPEKNNLDSASSAE